MFTLDGLRRKIDTATDLCSVVTTMKTLAAVRIHQYEEAVAALADYNRTIEMGLRIALAGQPLRLQKPHQALLTAAVVFGSDQGMCGQFNEEIVASVRRHGGRDHTRQPWKLIAVGSRAASRLLDAGCQPEHTHAVPTAASDITNLVQELLPQLEQLRSEAGISRLLVFYHQRSSASSFLPQRLQLLPMDERLLHRWRNEPWQSRSLPMFVSLRSRLLSQLVQQYLFVALFRACAESLASENAGRIAAMQSAEKNIEERIDELRGAFHRLRQSAITEELLDVVTGFEALSQPKRPA